MLLLPAKKLFLVHRKIFQFVDPVQHQDVFSQDLPSEFCKLQPLSGRNFLAFSTKITD